MPEQPKGPEHELPSDPEAQKACGEGNIGGPPTEAHVLEGHLLVRELQREDYERITEMQRACFPGMIVWSADAFESMLRRFPQGQLGIEYEGKIVASSSSLIVEYALYTDWHSWEEISDYGMIRNHDPDGDTLYGIEIMVDPDYRGMRLARRLYEARKNLVVENNLARIIIAGRIPCFKNYKDEMTAAEYVRRVQDKNLFDPVLTTQLANDFRIRAIVPDYLPSDEDSGGHAIVMEWLNPDFRPNKTFATRPVENVRLCAVQYQMRRVNDFDEFAQQCEYFVDVAADYGSDFVLFPELVTNQLLSLVKPDRPGRAARELAKYAPRYVEFFSDLAVRYNVHIIGGSTFIQEEDKLYNCAFLFGRDGSVNRQEKLHVTPNERRWWGVDPGRELRVFDTDRGKISIQVCYDVEFPELTRVAVERGARIVFVPFNTDTRAGYLRVRLCAQARCIENHIYTVIAGATGNLPFVENADIHYAQSGIFTPADISFARDAVAAECTPNIETLVVQDVDLHLLRRHKHTGTVRNWKDRRNDLYYVAYRDSNDQVDV